MPRWRVQYDPKTDGPKYWVKSGFGHALLAPVMAFAFDDLGVSASLWEPGQGWLPLSIRSGITRFELEHGVEGRIVYNEQSIARVYATKQAVVGEYLGCSDLFVPVLVGSEVEALIITGPFLRSRSTSASILQHFRKLTGRQGHPADPEFAWFFAEIERVLVLERRELATFRRLIEQMAELMSGTGNAEKTANRASALRAGLKSARFVDRMWEAVRVILDERSSQSWFTMHATVELRRLGATKIADHVLVGLASNLKPGDDPVDEALRRIELQRAAVGLAQEMGEVLTGPVADRGVVFLSGASGSAEQKRRRARAVADRMQRLARKDFGFSLHFGVAQAERTKPLSRSYFAALAAAENAFGSGEALVMSDDKSLAAQPLLRDLRREITSVFEEQTELVAPRFERYLAAVRARFVDRMEPARAHLDVVFDSLAEPLVKSGRLDTRTLSALCDALERSSAHALGMNDLCDAYRRAVSDLVQAVERPVAARQDRTLRVALDYIHQHYTEPLRLEQVARIAGFAPGHFSKLFVRREEMPFERYVRALRLERAKHLLVDTELDSTRIAELSGFGTAQYFCRVFRKEVGKAPLEYRKKPREYWPKRLDSPNKKARKSKQAPGAGR